MLFISLKFHTRISNSIMLDDQQFLQAQRVPDREQSFFRLWRAIRRKDLKHTWVLEQSIWYFYLILTKINMCRQEVLQITNMKCEEICQDGVAVTHADEQTLRRQ